MSIFSSRRGSQVGVPPQQKIKTGKNQKQKSIPIFRIYMVGFPHHESISGSLSIPDIVSELVPEAIVHEYQVLLGHNGGENIAQDWIVKEAISLLWRIQEDTQKEPTLASAKVLVAGYGLGGIILKEAIVVANTDSAFYDVSFQIFSLVFFDTMDKPTDLQSWEGLTHHMIGLTFTSDRVRASLYSVASRLAMSVSAVSTSFLRFIPKYSIRHYTGTADLSRIICDANVTDHGDVDDPGLGYYHSSIPLRTLRVCFAPNEVLLVGPDAGMSLVR
ncbi:hypothetical protein B0T21DRAFT_373123 [Apiosordaria backusii]|uniref:Uncharacterized protein n=1 Tax=Apiosordaria backusii TaxID=314023 RepID=A0AA40ASK2_9PEZI|nr:hypothetical protein B0T21DRAFT_373123 [Apiosordaria backusii]